MAQALSATAATIATVSGKRMEEFHEAIDLARIEDAMPAEGRHDRVGIALRRIVEDVAQRVAAEGPHPLALEARAHVVARFRSRARGELVAGDAVTFLRPQEKIDRLLAEGGKSRCCN